MFKGEEVPKGGGGRRCLRERKIKPMTVTTEVPPVSTKPCGSDSNNPYLASGNC